jgi:hypothetical protein
MTEEKKLNLNPVFLPVSSFFLATKLVLGERTSRRRSTGKGVVTKERRWRAGALAVSVHDEDEPEIE